MYDLKLEPDELTNVGREPQLTQQYSQYKGLVKVFQNRIDRWRKVTRDPVK